MKNSMLVRSFVIERLSELYQSDKADDVRLAVEMLPPGSGMGDIYELEEQDYHQIKTLIEQLQDNEVI